MIWIVPVFRNGQFTLPAPVRRKLKLTPGRDSVLLKGKGARIIVERLKRKEP